MSDKSDILDEVESVIAPTPKLGVRYLITMLLTVTMLLLLAFPKIYVQNQIYYKSRDIAVLKREFNALKEENRVITSKVESIRFKNQILDTLF
jgi:cell division protein FtsL